jgi:hypothetical protein
MAVRLLKKAESTDSDYEAIALAERSYSLLADTINAYDAACANQPGVMRRRERRRLFDRRSARRSTPAQDAAVAANCEEGTAADAYARLGNGGLARRRSVDFPL